MSKQERVHKPHVTVHAETEAERQDRPYGGHHGRPPHSADELKQDLDGVLDEIDALLEENAEEFVKGFVQHGGQ